MRPDAQRLRARFKLRDLVEVLEFGRTVAAIADQERHRVLRRARVVAGNERVDRLERVHEAVGEQEITRALDGRRRGGTCALAAGVVAGADQSKQVAGLDWLAGVGDQPEDASAVRRERKNTRLQPN